MLTPEISTAASPALIARGCVNVIGLELIRARASQRWSRMRETIYARLDLILRQRLRSSDFFMRLDETSYLVTMPTADADDARICCLRVAHELHNNLLGPCGLPDLHVSRVIGKQDGELQIEQIVPPELADLANRAGLRELLTIPLHESDAHPAQFGSGNLADRRYKLIYRFRPLWDARSEVITGYLLVVRRPPLPSLLEPFEPPEIFKEQLATFVSGLYHGAGVLTDCLQKGIRFLMTVPVPYEVLGSPVGRMEMIAACRSLSSVFRPFIVFEITDIPAGVPQTRMIDLVSTIRPFCKAVVAQAPLGLLSYDAYRNVGLQGLSISLQAPAATVSVRDEIERACTVARQAGIMSFILGIPSLELVEFARDKGARMISSAALANEVEQPAGMQRLSWFDVIGSGLRQAAS